MEEACGKIAKLILPAVRASIAETMNTKYSYTQDDIAKKLGVVQVAVSKYLNKKYSKGVAELKSMISEKGLNSAVIKSILDGRNSAHIQKEIEDLCANIYEST